MALRKATTRRRWSVRLLAPLLLFGLAGCGGAQTGSGGTAAGAADCEGYPSEDIRLFVPYSPGGGFDAWSRLMAPYIAKYLGGDVDVVVENLPGGGGMRAVNQIYSAPPDGSTIIYTEPGYISVNQILGRTGEGFDLRNLTYLGQVTADPQVFAVAADSEFDSIEDLAGQSIKHAAQDISPIETITYSAYGVNADYILHEGTSEVVLSIRRGDTDVTVASLSSILEFLKGGELKPIFYIGTEEITPDLLGYEQLKGTPTAADTGHPELAEVLEQHRVLAAPPDVPECIKNKLADALAKTLVDPEFEAKAEEAELRIVPGTAEEAADTVTKTLETFQKYKETLEERLSE